MSLSAQDYERMRERLRRLNPKLKQPEDCPPGRLVSNSQREQTPEYEFVAAVPGKVTCQGRVRIRVTSYRCRLLDDDNIALGAKPLVDCCVAAGFVPSDAPIWCKIEHDQEQVSDPTMERTEILLENL